MKTPLNITGEWASLTRVHDASLNLASLRRVRDWLDCVERYLEAGGDPDGNPQLRNYKPANVKGITDSQFDGVPTPTLRYWLEWWQQPERTWCGADEAGRHPAEYAARVQAELDARS